MSGASRYDLEARALLLHASADAVAIVVVGGDRGNGACVAVDAATSASGATLLRALAGALRGLARQIEADVSRGEAKGK